MQVVPFVKIDYVAHPASHSTGTLRLKCDGTRVETRFRLSEKRRSPFNL